MRTDVIEKLRAMAQADESPNERDIARTKLAEAGVPIDPPRPPAPPAASPSPQPFGRYGWTSSVSTTMSTVSMGWTHGVAYVRVTIS